MTAERGREAPELETLYTLQQVAVHFNVTEQTVRRWIKRGFIRARRAGPRKLLFSQKDINAAAPLAR